MSDTPDHGDTGPVRPRSRQQTERFDASDPAWTRSRDTGPRTIKLDRPFYTGMMLGFGLMLAAIVFAVVSTLVFGVIGILLGGAVTAPTLPG